MTLTTATTSTPTPTAASSATTIASVTKGAAQQLLTSLNTGSGVDTNSLVTSLVQAQFAAKTAALTAKSSTIAAQISATSSLKSTITGFSTALTALTTGGTLQTQPFSSNSGVVSVRAIAGAKVGTLTSSITVGALATAQGARSASVPDRTTQIGTGSFTLTLGKASYDGTGTAMTGFTAGGIAPVTIPVNDGSLDGIAAAINNAKTGVTASVVADQDGKAVLALKGPTGSDQAFTLQATVDTSGKLAQFNVGQNAPMTLTGTAGNAKLTVDGVTVERGSNTISDLVSGVKLQLTGVSTTPVSLGSTRPTSALSQAVSDFVDTYNQVYASAKEATDPINGDLKADTAAKTLLRSLQTLTTKSLVSGAPNGAPATLAQIGISTNRDGTLSVDANKLNAALNAYPDQVEAMFAPTTGNALGLQSSLSAITLAASSSAYGLGASADRYAKAKADLGTQQSVISTQSDAMTTRLTQQFSSMNSKVTAYKATQTFLENQIKAWNSSN